VEFRRLPLPAKALYLFMLGVFATLAIFAAVEGWWFYCAVSLVLGALFGVSGLFVLGQAWRPPSAGQTRKPVVRRRR
jgi:hypothetical protein